MGTEEDYNPVLEDLGVIEEECLDTQSTNWKERILNDIVDWAGEEDDWRRNLVLVVEQNEECQNLKMHCLICQEYSQLDDDVAEMLCHDNNIADDLDNLMEVVDTDKMKLFSCRHSVLMMLLLLSQVISDPIVSTCPAYLQEYLTNDHPDLASSETSQQCYLSSRQQTYL